MKEDNPKLLPYGFKDLKGASAKKHFFTLNTLINKFIDNGYELIIPSLLEFASDSRVKNLDNCFKTTDPKNNKSLALRDDITKQIIRGVISEDDIKDAKICYYGNAYQVYDKNSHSAREYTQVGFENISEVSAKRNLEALSLTLDVLKELEVNDISISFSLPKLYEEFAKTIKNQEILKEILIEKNLSKISREKELNRIKKFLIPGSFSNDELMKEFPKSKYLSDVITLIESLNNLFPDFNILLDPFDYKKFSYHTDFVFSILKNDTKQVIASGGCYNISEKQEAIGTSFYLDNLL